MKLWLVSTDAFDYDEYDAFVIRAESAEAAREIAHEHDTDWSQGKNFWLSSAEVTVTEVSPEGEPGEILASFNAG